MALSNTPNEEERREVSSHPRKMSTMVDESTAFWQSQFAGLDAGRFPYTLKHPSDPSHHNSNITQNAEMQDIVQDVTIDANLPNSELAPLLRTAWAVLLSRYSGSPDTVFGVHDARTSTTMPVRVLVDEEMSVGDLVREVRRQMADLAPLQATGLARIRAVGDEARRACDFETLLVEMLGDEKGGKNEVENEKGETKSWTPPQEIAESCTLMLTYTRSTRNQGRLSIIFYHQPGSISRTTISHLASQLGLILHQVTLPSLQTTKLAHLPLAPAADLLAIWTRNTDAKLPPRVQTTVHQLVTARAAAAPTAPAVHAWDGVLSYAQLDHLSDRLARHLAANGVAGGAVVPLLLEKSVWVPVAVLAVMKAGAASVLLDVGLPPGRMRSIVTQLPAPASGRARLVLCSAEYEATARELGIGAREVLMEALAVDQMLLDMLPAPDSPMTSTSEWSVDPDAPLYVVFTSGSTGPPKGAVITHSNFVSAARHHQGALGGFGPTTRVFDLVSNAFDVAWSNLLHPLTGGGCLCIPSEAQRATGAAIARAFTDLGANYLHVTPTVARVLDPAQMPGLERILFIGEPLTWPDAERWEKEGVRVYNTYGPAECTVTSTVTRLDATAKLEAYDSKPSIGRPVGAVAWVVHPDGQRLAALGTEGELWLEGPIVGAGYLNDPQRTSAVFVDDPCWLLAGLDHGKHAIPGRRGRLYRTGDMVRCNEDGTLSFVGRRDGQVKIRGQRIELGEVEQHVREAAPPDQFEQVVAEVVQSERTGSKILIVFFALRDLNGNMDSSDRLKLSHRAAPIIASIRDVLVDRLPAAMLPSAYIPVSSLPMTASGKTDRKKLRELGAALDSSDYLSSEDSDESASNAGSTEASTIFESEPSTTKTEHTLLALWRTVLPLPLDADRPVALGPADSFLRRGGDSLAAMRLVDGAHAAGLALSVQDVLRNPRLRDMARVADSNLRSTTTHGDQIPPFSLLKPDSNGTKPIQEAVRQQLSVLLSIAASEIEDVFPCTPLQEGLLAMTALHPGQYVANSVSVLRPDVDAERMRQACTRVVAQMAILRTRIVDMPDQGLVQVVLSSGSPPPQVVSNTSCLPVSEYWREEAAGQAQMGLGTELARFAIVQDHVGDTPKMYLAWTMHHAVYDGWSLELLQTSLERAYHDLGAEYNLSPRLTPTPGLQPLVRHIFSSSVSAQRAYWHGQFQHLDAAQFPALPTATHMPRADATAEHMIDGLVWPAGIGRRDSEMDTGLDVDVTPSAVIRAAWALLVARRCATPDAVFGAVVLGRQAAVPGISKLAGPTIASVPVRVRVNAGEGSEDASTVAEFLARVGDQATEMIPHEQTGWQAIRRVGEEAERACGLAQSLLVVQPLQMDQSDPENVRLFVTPLDDERDSGVTGIDAFSTHALNLVCQITPTGCQLKLFFDTGVVSPSFADAILQTLDHTLRQLCQPSVRRTALRDLDLVRPADLARIWAWNVHPPAAAHACMHDLISTRARQDPAAPAICAWDGALTYGRLNALSTRLAHLLVREGVRIGDIIPLCFEKSMWTAVAQLAVMKAGAASVTLDTLQPEERLRTIVQQVGERARVLLSGLSTRQVAEAIAGKDHHVFVVGSDAFPAEDNYDQPDEELALTLPSVHPSDLLYLVFTSGSTGLPKGAMITHANFASASLHHATKLGFKPTSRVADFASYAFDVAWANMLNTLTSGGCLCVPSEHERQHDMIGFMARAGVNYVDVTPAVAALLDAEVDVGRGEGNMPGLTGLQTVVVGGELVELDKLRRLRERVQSLIITYGPAECTVTACAVDVCKAMLADGSSSVPVRSIGFPCGATTWIVDPANHDALVPVGAVGELLLEGPLNGPGYLDDAEKTKAAFVDDTKWLIRGSEGSNGRRGRLYKTGDLVKYHHDGSLVFVGRRDAQVKIRGQRVDLSEVELHVRRLLPAELLDKVYVVAEVVRPRGSTGPMLVVFFGPAHVPSASADRDRVEEDEQTPTETTGTLQVLLAPLLPALERDLSLALPRFMIPAAYLPLPRVQLSATGKLDRRAVRAHAAALDISTVVSRAAHEAPATPAEMEMRALWASVLGLEEAKIGAHDSFLRLGGDSVAAMRLAAATRRSALLRGMMVAQVMRTPKLRELAAIVAGGTCTPSSSTADGTASSQGQPAPPWATEPHVEPFSLLQLNGWVNVHEIRHAAAAQMSDLGDFDVEDVLPCTPLQEGLMALTAQKAGRYVQRTRFELQPGVDLARLRHAWDAVVAAAPILRTRIVELGNTNGQALVQVVLRHRPLAWSHGTSMEEYRRREEDQERNGQTMCLGSPLVAFGIVDESHRRYFALTQHHTTYDGWSLRLLFDAVEQAYLKQDVAALGNLNLVPFQPFIQYLTSQNPSASAAFWTQQFADLDVSHFPSVPAHYRPQADQAFDHTIHDIHWPTSAAGADLTPATVLRAAWATLLSWHSGSADVVFGVVVLGRQAPITDCDMDRLAGPTIATVPVRAVVGEDVPVVDLLRLVHEQAVDMIPFEHTGLQNIARLGEDARRACAFQTLLVVQAAETSDTDNTTVSSRPSALFRFGNSTHDDSDNGARRAELAAFGTYALTLTCDLAGPAVHLRIGFDSTIITPDTARRLSHQFEHILRQFAPAAKPVNIDSVSGSDPGLSVGQLSMTSPHDLVTLWQEWNRTVPSPISARVHDIFQQRVREDPSAPAVCAHDGDLTFGALDVLSTRLARHLHHEMSVRPGVIVPLCFEKSVWVPLAILGVMKAGGASVTMDATLPVERLRGIVEQVAPVVVLNSPGTCEEIAPQIKPGQIPTLTIDQALLDTLAAREADQDRAGVCPPDLPVVDPQSPLYLVFTSGSTGKPKGAVVSHANFASSAAHHQTPLGVERTSRIYDFTSYAFDVAWSNMLHAFTAGACLCIPSEQDRLTDVAGSIARLKADFVHITPTVANVLEPIALPTMKKLLFTGEALPRGDVARWRVRPDVEYYNTYGPAECTVTSAVARVDPFNENEPTIGRPYGVLAWIVRPDGRGLAAVGAPGELWIEGPTVGAGYLNNLEKTAATFVEDPTWLLRGEGGVGGVPGRRGRLYRTGDMARYSADGKCSLIYLGRRDTQVKIRGQRIELGEVEYHVRRLLPSDVQQIVAEVVTPDAMKVPILAVFFTAAQGENGEILAMVATLQQQLARAVPPSMVPTAYIPVAELPMTPSGKTDRRALRALGQAYIPPGVDDPTLGQDPLASSALTGELTTDEQILRQIWAGILRIDPCRIGPDHSFTRLGGDSIRTMSLAVALRREWDLQVPLPRLLAGSAKPQSDTLRSMALLVRRLQQEQGSDDALEPVTVDMTAELAGLRAQLRAALPLSRRTNSGSHLELGPTNRRPILFLTGATGYLGTHLLHHILTSGTFGRVVLLVRRAGAGNGTGKLSGMDRVRVAALLAGWWDESFSPSLEIWEGDLAAPRLGLTDGQWAALCGVSAPEEVANTTSTIDVVVHNGAAVHWRTSYEQLKFANVLSTLQLLQAALCSRNLARFVYVSGGLSARDWERSGGAAAAEATGYDISKYVSEQLVAAAAVEDADRDKGLEFGWRGGSRFAVVKPGLIIGDAKKGIANPDDFLWRVVAAAARLGARPVEGPGAWLAVAEAPFVARAVLRQFTAAHARDGVQQKKGYVELDHGMSVDAFWAAVEDALGQLLRRVEWDEWIDLAQVDIAQERERHPLFPVQQFLGKLGEDGLQGNEGSSEEAIAEAVRMNVRYLRKAGFLGVGVNQPVRSRQRT